VHATESHKKIPEILIKNKIYANLSSVSFVKHLYMIRTLLLPLHKMYSWWWAVDTPRICRGVWRNILKIKCASGWFFFKWIYRDARSTKHKTQKYCWSWNVKQTKLFICVTTLLAYKVLENMTLLLNQMFCFTVLETYFLLVVYSLYRELKGTAPPNSVQIVRLNITSYEGNVTTLVCPYRKLESSWWMGFYDE